MTRLPTPPLPDRVTRQLNADGDEARISREAADASHSLLEIEDATEDAVTFTYPLVAGGQGRTAKEVSFAAGLFVLMCVAILAVYGVVSLVHDLWRAIGGAA